MAKRLTDAAVRKASPRERDYTVSDAAEPGFFLRVSSKGLKTWGVVARTPTGKQVRKNVGRYPDLGLVEAREEAREKLTEIRTGRLRGKRTYRDCVDEYHRVWLVAKKKNRSADTIRKRLITVGADWLGADVKDIGKSDVNKALDATIAAGHPVLANRYHAHLKTFLKWCAGQRDYIPFSPVAELDRPYDGEQSRDRHYDDAEIKAILQAADAIGHSIGDALKLMVWTGRRRNEVFQAKWEEFDLERGLWTLPAERSKNGRAHTVVLPKAAREMLEARPEVKDDPYVFQSAKAGAPISGFTSIQRKVQKLSKVEDFHFHALRHTLATRLATRGMLEEEERDREKLKKLPLACPPHVRWAVLNHAPPGGAAEGYNHAEYLHEAGDWLERWAVRLDEIVTDRKAPDNVVAMHG